MGVFALRAGGGAAFLPLSTAAVVLLAMASGLFVVPLYAFIQQRSDRPGKGPRGGRQQFLPDDRHADGQRR